MSSEEPILRVENLEKYYDTSEGFIDTLLGESQKVKAVDDVSFELMEGETLGVVGESGCGKSTLGQAMIRLIEPTGGSVYYRGTDLTELSSSGLRDIRKNVQYIFQDPYSSLNPRMTVGDIIREPLEIHDLGEGGERDDRVYELLETVGLNPSHANRYPHEFSGGQKQRIGIARALAVDPEVVICDEPVSALDVSVQAQILNLLEDLQEEFDLSYVFIAHDLSVVEHISDRVGVMYLGKVAEIGPTQSVYAPPYHPYTEALLSAIPEPDPLWEGDQIFLRGAVPSPIDPPSGCRFHTRCPRIIQGGEYDIDQVHWRSLMNLRQRARSAETAAAVTAIDEDADEATVEPAEIPESELEELIREEFDLPDRFGDPDADEAISAFVATLHDEGITPAAETISERVTSPCERTVPPLIESEGGSDHRIACLLYDEEYAGMPPEFVTESTETKSDDPVAGD
ncbi:peptide/nickel transport system ATP-binding protein [Halalkaliarchaeum desulfuricum]|uniref:Peptide/nickel transport system ATP-binding protein n=1 Tax=Halalkaliarchaeum desulfuricum TaxID=2055893 RepID=A0A343TKR1_9EURY|nr:oligopeptide/dipeptide ABC transporter ATP-binding protein [Halalkaliarchaeum desulfuricum]AUX09683.1 peptide/nickel transport system ATP-binding protein [Halalkaliarchaeum desulfuricum]